MHFEQQVNVLLAVLFASGIEVYTQQHLALRRELDGVAPQVDEHLLKPQRVANEHLGDGVVNVKQQLQLLGLGVAGVNDGQVANQLVKAERLGVKLHLAGFNLGKIEDVVQDAQQALGGTFALFGIVFLPRRQRRGLQQVKHAQNGIHGGPDFVAHVGHKLALGARCGFGILTRPGQLRDVHIAHHHANVDIVHRHGADGQHHLIVVSLHTHHLVADCLVAGQCTHTGIVFCGHGGAVIPQDAPFMAVVATRQMLCLADTQQALTGRVAIHDVARRIGDGDADWQHLKNGLLAHQRLLGDAARIFQLAHIKAQTHRHAFGRAALHHSQRCAILQRNDAIGGTGAEPRQPIAQPSVPLLVAQPHGTGIEPGCDERLKRDADPQHASQRLVHVEEPVIGQHQPLVGIEHGKSRPHRFKRAGQQVLFLGGLFAGSNQFGHVRTDARHQHGASTCVPLDHAPTVLHPHHMAVFVDGPKGQVVIRRLALPVLHQSLLGAGEVVWMRGSDQNLPSRT